MFFKLGLKLLLGMSLTWVLLNEIIAFIVSNSIEKEHKEYMRVALTIVYRDVFQTHEGCKEGNVKTLLTIL